MKDMGQLRFCLVINFEVTEQVISLCQKQYLIKLLERYRLSEANTVATQMDPSVKLVQDDSYSKKVDPIQYQSMLGSLLHAAKVTRPDIAHAVGKCQSLVLHQHRPTLLQSKESSSISKVLLI